MAKYKGVNVLEVLEGADRYNNWIAQRIMSYIASPALEIGAGIGNISSFFTHLQELTLTDFDQSLVEKLNKRFQSKKNIKAEVLDIQKDFSKVRTTFKTVYSVNVLEHLKDDEKALRNIHNMLDSKGKVVLLVPAKRFAYTNLDKDLGHYRRYEKKELVDKLEKAGFKVKEVSFFNAAGLASWIIRDKISNGESLKPYQVKLFDMVVPLLRRLEPKKIMPIGISLIAVGEKR